MKDGIVLNEQISTFSMHLAAIPLPSLGHERTFRELTIFCDELTPEPPHFSGSSFGSCCAKKKKEKGKRNPRIHETEDEEKE